MDSDLKEILDQYQDVDRSQLIPVMQEIQDKLGYLNGECIREISKLFEMHSSKIYGLATFYDYFRFKPKGKYHIKVCNGTNCYIEKNSDIIKEIFKQLNIKDGETSLDEQFSLEISSCMGSCANGPVLMVNEKIYTHVSPVIIREIVGQLKS